MKIIFWMVLGPLTEDGRSMTTFYYCSVNHQSGLQSNIFKIIIYSFNTSKCAANYVISFEVYRAIGRSENQGVPVVIRWA